MNSFDYIWIILHYSIIYRTHTQLFSYKLIKKQFLLTCHLHPVTEQLHFIKSFLACFISVPRDTVILNITRTSEQLNELWICMDTWECLKIADFRLMFNLTKKNPILINESIHSQSSLRDSSSWIDNRII